MNQFLAALLAAILVLSAPFLFSSNVQINNVKFIQTRDFTLSQYQNSPPIMITDDLAFVTAGASGVGTRADPYVIENLAISSDVACIIVANTTAYFVIYNCILESAHEPAIRFDNVENGQVILCESIYGGDGIIIANSRDCAVSNTSIISSTTIGITIRESSNCTITNSRFYNNGWGLNFRSSSYCRIINNSIYSNRYNGIDFTHGSHNNTIYGNSIGWNDPYRGIEQNAVDWGEDNHFDDGVSIGNAWTDFNGTAPYGIQGSSGSIDSFPELLEDTENPVVFGPMDTVFDIETSGNSLTWTAYDEFPTTYSIQIDERDPDEGGHWNGGSITIDLGTILVTGTYRYNLTVYDVAGNTASDEVIVTVISFILGGIGTELVMVASGFTVVIFLVIILIIKRLS